RFRHFRTGTRWRNQHGGALVLPGRKARSPARNPCAPNDVAVGSAISGPAPDGGTAGARRTPLAPGSAVRANAGHREDLVVAVPELAAERVHRRHVDAAALGGSGPVRVP